MQNILIMLHKMLNDYKTHVTYINTYLIYHTNDKDTAKTVNIQKILT